MKTLKALLLLAVVLSVDHSVTADPIPDSNSLELLKRSVWDFRNIILCNMPGSWPIMDYSNYGCYCGMGGKGTPVDDLDRCCQVHDNCYGEAQIHNLCFPDGGIVNPYLPYFWRYQYTCDGANKKVTCSPRVPKLPFDLSPEEKITECLRFLCECDRAAGECFAKSTYNPANKRMDQSRCK